MSGSYQLFPPLEPDALADLEADIKANGIKIPIEYDPDGNLLEVFADI